MTQPILSRQQMDLEEEFGKKLLIRRNRRITLTEEGMLLHKRATKILDLVEKTEAELMAPNEAIGGRYLYRKRGDGRHAPYRQDCHGVAEVLPPDSIPFI